MEHLLGFENTKCNICQTLFFHRYSDGNGNVNCTNCVNCGGCVNCHNCRDCHGSVECNVCTNCNGCVKCTGCANLGGSVNNNCRYGRSVRLAFESGADIKREIEDINQEQVLVSEKHTEKNNPSVANYRFHVVK